MQTQICVLCLCVSFFLLIVLLCSCSFFSASVLLFLLVPVSVPGGSLFVFGYVGLSCCVTFLGVYPLLFLFLLAFPFCFLLGCMRYLFPFLAPFSCLGVAVGFLAISLFVLIWFPFLILFCSHLFACRFP